MKRRVFVCSIKGVKLKDSSQDMEFIGEEGLLTVEYEGIKMVFEKQEKTE